MSEVTSPPSAACEKCSGPFTPVTFQVPLRNGRNFPITSRLCDSCSAALRAEDEAAKIASKNPVARLSEKAPITSSNSDIICIVCGHQFTCENMVLPGDGNLRPLTLSRNVCDECDDKEKAAREAHEAARKMDDRSKKRFARWVELTGTRYRQFRSDLLPDAIEPFTEQVLAWLPQSVGIGLLGPPRTGKSPLIYGLGQKLYMAGHDVFPTSGIEFQRQVHRSVEHKDSWISYLDRCENAPVLLIDDADKLNLTPGVESEYYGMLEHRRNWSLPVLCTLNLAGDEFRALAKGREDRAAAIVERLRDLCQFISVDAPTDAVVAI